MKNGLGNAKECKTLIKHGLIKVNGQIITDNKYIVKFEDIIKYQDKILLSQPFSYYMLNKPKGYVCANSDEKYKCVMELIDNKQCYCLGRLDMDTTGLLIVTDDKSLSKRLLLPQNHVNKKYLVTTTKSLNNDLVNRFNEGIIIDQDSKCKSAKLEIIDDYNCYLTISEGKYHQIKKMFLSCNNQVLQLHRVQFKNLKLGDLKQGQYRKLTNEEILDLSK